MPGFTRESDNGADGVGCSVVDGEVVAGAAAAFPPLETGIVVAAGGVETPALFALAGLEELRDRDP
jgi:hypothetical protein